METKNCLLWDFPGSSIVIPYCKVIENCFLSPFASFIERASAESLHEFSATVIKAGVASYETRNTSDPAIITSLLTAILEAVGHRLALPITRKRIRDDVSFNDGGNPWRRLPLWLVARVSLSRYFYHVLGHQEGRLFYKLTIAHFHAYTMNLILPYLGVDEISYMRAKVARRLAKLEVAVGTVSSVGAAPSQVIMSQLKTFFEASIQASTTRLENFWRNTREKCTSKIPSLPRYPSDGDLNLSLVNSMPYMTNAINRYEYQCQQKSCGPIISQQTRLKNLTYEAAFSNKIFNLFQEEEFLRQNITSQPKLSHKDELERYCKQLSEAAKAYICEALVIFAGNPESKSLMILIAMEVWVIMDSSICRAIPLLEEFHPTFYPGMMDVLLLPYSEDMKRAREVQKYLHDRINVCGQKASSIFSEPGCGSFAERFFDTSEELQLIYEQISLKAAEKKESKKREWQRKNDTYIYTTGQIDRMSCTYTKSPFSRYQRHDQKNCQRCKLQKCAEKLKIEAYEEMLPGNNDLSGKAKAVVFELACPTMYSTYRDFTWLILSKLGYYNLKQGPQVKQTVHNYSQLKPYSQSDHHTITLGSQVKPCKYCCYCLTL